VLIGVQDVAVMLEDECGNAGDDSFTIGTADEENSGIFHDSIPRNVVQHFAWARSANPGHPSAN
jgi:hypothetical protein